MSFENGLAGKIVLIITTVALIALAVIVVKNTPNSLPGDFIYPFKAVVENFRLSQQEFEFKYAGRTSIYLDMLQARFSEIEQLIKRKNKDKEIIATTKRLLEVQEKTLNNLGHAKIQGGNTPPLFTRLESILRQEQNNLSGLTFEVSQPTREAITKIIEQSKIDLERLDAMR